MKIQSLLLAVLLLAAPLGVAPVEATPTPLATQGKSKKSAKKAEKNQVEGALDIQGQAGTEAEQKLAEEQRKAEEKAAEEQRKAEEEAANLQREAEKKQREAAAKLAYEAQKAAEELANLQREAEAAAAKAQEEAEKEQRELRKDIDKALFERLKLAKNKAEKAEAQALEAYQHVTRLIVRGDAAKLTPGLIEEFGGGSTGPTSISRDSRSKCRSRTSRLSLSMKTSPACLKTYRPLEPLMTTSR